MTLNHTITGADMVFHMKRILELKRDVSNGNYYPIFSFNFGNGAATMGMYPYLTLFPIILFSFMGFSIFKSVFLFFTLNLFLSLMISFGSSLRFSRSRLVSYLFSLLYTLSLPLLIMNFTSMDLGMATSYIYFPLVVFGLLDILHGYDNFIKLSVGLSLTMFSQIPATAIAIMLILFLVVININKLDFSIIVNLLKALGMFVLLTGVYWVPLVNLMINNRINKPSFIQLTGFNAKFFFEYVSIFSVLSIVLTLFYFIHLDRYLKQMYVISVLVILLSSPLVPYKLITSYPGLGVLNNFQFTYRFLVIPQMFLSFLLSAVVYKVISKSGSYKALLTALSMFLIIANQLLCQAGVNAMHSDSKQFPILVNSTIHPINRIRIINKHQVKYLENYSIGLFTGQDYLPQASSMKLKNIISESGQYRNKLIPVRNVGYNTYRFRVNYQIHKLALPIVKYNQEDVRLYDNGRPARFYTNKHNLMTLGHVDKGVNNIKLKWSPNIKIRLLSILLSVVGLIILGFGII